jgi:hypothetical protein
MRDRLQARFKHVRCTCIDMLCDTGISFIPTKPTYTHTCKYTHSYRAEIDLVLGEAKARQNRLNKAQHALDLVSNLYDMRMHEHEYTEYMHVLLYSRRDVRPTCIHSTERMTLVSSMGVLYL